MEAVESKLLYMKRYMELANQEYSGSLSRLVQSADKNNLIILTEI